MQIIVQKKGAAVVLGIRGRFNGAEVPEFDRVCNRQVESGERRFILNLAELTFISSAGLRSILAAEHQIKELNGKLMICSLRDEPLKVFEISGFAALFALYPTEAAALKQV